MEALELKIRFAWCQETSIERVRLVDESILTCNAGMEARPTGLLQQLLVLVLSRMQWRIEVQNHRQTSIKMNR